MISPESGSERVIDIATMAEVNHEDDQLTIADGVDNAVVTDPDAQ